MVDGAADGLTTPGREPVLLATSWDDDMTSRALVQPLDDAAFAACMAPFDPFEDRPFLAVAVSGGSDSLALTLLADRWARARGGRIAALTVDHGLRPGSADEARRTGNWIEARGIEHHILPWTGGKPASGLQHRARDARYALLSAWCRDHRCLHLLAAHHRQDQAETVAIRKARQSGEAGLAGMAAIRDLPGVRLLRPLLGVDKAVLEATLQAAAQPWIEDPSNADPAFTRTHLRKAGLDVAALIAEAEDRGRRRQAADHAAADALVRCAVVDPAGFVALDRAAFRHLAPDLARDLLTRALLTVGGRPYPPRSEALTRLIEAMVDGMPDGARTLADCRIFAHAAHWLIGRERPSAERLALVPGGRQRWDGRFTVRLYAERADLMVAALGDRPRQGERTLIAKGKTRRLPGRIARTLPAIFRDDRLIAIPHLGLYGETLAPEHIDLRFCPDRPLANAAFLPHIRRL